MQGHTSAWSTRLSQMHLLRDFTYLIGLESLLILGTSFVAGQVLLHICSPTEASVKVEHEELHLHL
jgi:hypothetical protein